MKRFNPFKIYQAAKKPKIPKKSEEVANEESDEEELPELPFPFNFPLKNEEKISTLSRSGKGININFYIITFFSYCFVI